MQNSTIGIIGIVISSWVAASPMVFAAWGFFSKTKTAINGFNIHLKYFTEKFEKIVKDIEELQNEQKEISEELGPVRRNGSIMTSHEHDRRMESLKTEIRGEIKQLSTAVNSELRIIGKIIENSNKNASIDHEYIEKKVIETMKNVRDSMLP